MQIIAILLIFAIWQSVGGNTSSENIHDPNEDNEEYIILKTLFTKLNTILEENRQINLNLIELNKKQDQHDKYMQRLLEHFNVRKNSFNVTKSDWTVIQRRQDGSVDFHRNWADYKQGFGNENGEFFIGLDRLYSMTNSGPQYELLIILKDFDNQSRNATYDKFVIGSEHEKYALRELGKYSGDAGDSLSPLKGIKFSAKDQHNDNNSVHCSDYYKGGWWFDKCYIDACNLNGPYIKDSSSKNTGIIWVKWLGYDKSLKSVEMMIRPKTN